MEWRVIHRDVTESTNKDALGGMPGDVFTANLQTAGKGRLDHRWLSPYGENLMMSVVLDVSALPPHEVAALPLVAGLAAAETVHGLFAGRGGVGISGPVRIKWPNDVLVGRRKICGILCERNGDSAIVGIGLNVNQKSFDPVLEDRATSMVREVPPDWNVERVRDVALANIASSVAEWGNGGFAALWPRIAQRDFLKGRQVSVLRTDDDSLPASGMCGGILKDGSLDVGGEAVYAGEAHVAEPH